MGEGGGKSFQEIFFLFSLLYFVLHPRDFHDSSHSPVSFVIDNLTGHHKDALSTSLAGEEEHINDRNSQLQFHYWAISSLSQLSNLHLPCYLSVCRTFIQLSFMEYLGAQMYRDS